MSVQFHQTQMGRKFYESDFPRMVRALEKIAEHLEKKDKTLFCDEHGEHFPAGELCSGCQKEYESWREWNKELKEREKGFKELDDFAKEYGHGE